MLPFVPITEISLDYDFIIEEYDVISVIFKNLAFVDFYWV